VPVQPQYRDYVLEQLDALPALRSTRMFGGVGLYSDGLFFGLIHDDTLFFKSGEGNIADYLSRNMPKFMPFPEKTRQVLGYHQVPADVIEDAEQLVAWAVKSKMAALQKKDAKATRARPRGPVRLQPASGGEPPGKKVKGKKAKGKKAKGKTAF